jgi:hypothetical protein
MQTEYSVELLLGNHEHLRIRHFPGGEKHHRLARTLIGRLGITPWKRRGRLFGGMSAGSPRLRS